MINDVVLEGIVVKAWVHPPLVEIAQFETVRLFVERAQTISPEFCLNADNAAVVLQICVCLDGIPLAIELAAARLRLLSVQKIAGRLENLFHLLPAVRTRPCPGKRPSWPQLTGPTICSACRSAAC